MTRTEVTKTNSNHAPADALSAERALGVALALMSASAGAIHFSVAGAHFEESFLHGLFFVATGWFQVLWAGAAVMRPSGRLWIAGAAFNSVVIVTWIVSRTVGVPFGPNAGVPEAVSTLDVTATALEAAIVLGSLAVLGATFRKRAPIATAVLMGGAVAIVAATSVALVTGSSSEHGHGAEAVAAHGHEHELTPQGEEVYVRLKGVLEDEGTAAALAGLRKTIDRNPALAGESHQIVHALGRYSFRFYGDGAIAFSNCTADFESGCYHGVLEAYLNDNPEPTPTDIRVLCGGAIQATESQFVRFQCVHGLGHGLSLHFGHDLFQALSHCDYLGRVYERSSCYGGAFMENIIFAQAPQSDRASERRNVYLKESDPHYPCSALAERYLVACYQMQTSAMIWFNGWDVAATFGECDRAPAGYIGICYESMGRDIGGRTQGALELSKDMCKEGTDEYQDACFSGVAKYLVNRDGTMGKALQFCSHVPEVSISGCYEIVGQQMFDLSSQEREQECSQAPRAYMSDCRRGAGLTT